MYRKESSVFEQNIHYHIVESPKYEPSYSFFGNDYPAHNNTNIDTDINTSSNNTHNHNDSLVLAFHTSLLCFKIALCILL